MNEAWLIIGPVGLAIAGYFVGSELKRLNNELLRLRQDMFHVSIDLAKIKEALEK
jgi:hypothetical protein